MYVRTYVCMYACKSACESKSMVGGDQVQVRQVDRWKHHSPLSAGGEGWGLVACVRTTTPGATSGRGGGGVA